METLFCPWEPAQYLIFSSNVPTLLFYSHIPTVIASLGIAYLVFLKTKRSLLGSTLLFVTIVFSLWSIFDLFIWATNNPKSVLFFWSLQVFLEFILFTSSLYLTYLFVWRKNIQISWGWFFLLLFIPIAIFIPYSYNLIGVTLADCNAIEGPLAQYGSYIFEALSILFILLTAYRAWKANEIRRAEIEHFTIGIVIFLLAFSWGNIIGSFIDNWAAAQAGLIGMPVFIGILSYLIIKYRSFNTKIFGVQILVGALIILILGLLFISDITIIHIAISGTLIFVIGLGYLLMQSVAKEIEQREHLEQLRIKLEQTNLSLEIANDKLKDLDKLKTEFLSLASHQLRSPLTAIKGYTSMLLEGDFGTVNDNQKQAIDRVYQSVGHLTKVVEDLLNVTKIELGGMQYSMAPFDVAQTVKDISEEQRMNALQKGLKLIFEADMSNKTYTCLGDQEKLRQVFMNFIDNSIKYTKHGSIVVKVEKSTDTKKIRFSVTDTGMGMKQETIANIFDKFKRTDASKKENTGGSGLGLYLAKQIVEAHHGKVIVTSPGEGYGSTFAVELALATPSTSNAEWKDEPSQIVE